MSPDPVNSQKAENYFVLGGFSSVPECGFLCLLYTSDAADEL